MGSPESDRRNFILSHVSSFGGRKVIGTPSSFFRPGAFRPFVAKESARFFVFGLRIYVPHSHTHDSTSPLTHGPTPSPLVVTDCCIWIRRQETEGAGEAKKR